MRRTVLILLSVAVLCILNYAVYDKQRIVRSGDTVLLRLAPVDPRSLMQGDYMRLRYAIERDIDAAPVEERRKRGEAVIRTAENGVARFIRIHEGEPLGQGERLIRFHRNRHQSVRIVPDSFFFQEGLGDQYAHARYGIFKFDDAHDRVLVGLADENLQPISPGGG